MRNVGWLELWGTEPRAAEGYIWETRAEAEACAKSDSEPSRVYRISPDWTLKLIYENQPSKAEKETAT